MVTNNSNEFIYITFILIIRKVEYTCLCILCNTYTTTEVYDFLTKHILGNPNELKTHENCIIYKLKDDNINK